MNITVYLGSSMGRSDEYKEKAIELGNWIGSNGHTLIYGGSKTGLMGILADSVINAGGKVVGVEPRFFVEGELQHETISDLIVTETLADRRLKLMEMGDYFIAFPGGAGTLDELTEVICMMTVDDFDKSVIVYNYKGYYDYLEKQLDLMVREEFLMEKVRNRVVFISDIAELEDII